MPCLASICRDFVLKHRAKKSPVLISPQLLAQGFHSDLEAPCLSFMYQGLAASTCRTYSCAQQKFINFCVMIGHVSYSGSPCSATEWTLCLFATFLADSLRHCSIKVYLSAVRSLHADQGFPDPLENCLRLQRVVSGIKGSQGSLPANPHLPISSNILRIIHLALDLNSFDDHMFWATCLLAYFGFLRSAEFTIPSLSAFDPSRHLSVRDIAVDVPLNPSCLQIYIKASKTDPFQKGCNILIGLVLLLCAQFKQCSPSLSVLAPCSFSRMAFLCLTHYLQTD